MATDNEGSGFTIQIGGDLSCIVTIHAPEGDVQIDPASIDVKIKTDKGHIRIKTGSYDDTQDIPQSHDAAAMQGSGWPN